MFSPYYEATRLAASWGNTFNICSIIRKTFEPSCATAGRGFIIIIIIIIIIVVAAVLAVFVVFIHFSVTNYSV